MFGYSSVKRKPLGLAIKGAACWGQEHYTTWEASLPLQCSWAKDWVFLKDCTPEKEKNGSNLTVLQCKEATGRSTKAVPQTVTPFVTYEHHSLFALFQSEDCPRWG